MLGNFSYCNPTKLYFGENSLSNLSDEDVYKRQARLPRTGDETLPPGSAGHSRFSIPVRGVDVYKRQMFVSAARKIIVFQPIPCHKSESTRIVRNFSLLAKKLTGAPPNALIRTLTIPSEGESRLVTMPAMTTQDRKYGR